MGSIKYFLVISLFFPCINAYADTGIITATLNETDKIKEKINIKEKVKNAGRDFFIGEINNKRTILVRSPMGKINNAITAQILISNFNTDRIISIGFAGAISPPIQISDIVIAEELYQHDIGIEKPYGFIIESPQHLPTDPKLTNAIYASLSEQKASKIFKGVIASGDQFIASPDKKRELYEKFKALAVDTNSAAIIQVCRANNIPCAIVRIISDKAEMDGRIEFKKSLRTQGINEKIITSILEVIYE